jgi:hypothetical protein
VNTTTLVWGDDLGGVKAQVGNVTYYIGSAYGGFETYLMMRGPARWHATAQPRELQNA